MKNFKYVIMSMIFLVTLVGCEKYESESQTDNQTETTSIYSTFEESTLDETGCEETTTTVTDETTKATTTTTTTETTISSINSKETSVVTTKITTEKTSTTTTTAPAEVVNYNYNNNNNNNNTIKNPIKVTTTVTTETTKPDISTEETTINTLSNEDANSVVSSFLDSNDIVTTISETEIEGSINSDITVEVTEISEEKNLEEFSDTTLLTTILDTIIMSDNTSCSTYEETTSSENTIEETTEVGTEPIATEPIATEEILDDNYVVYKPSTNYIHRSTCHWVNDTCIKIDEIGDLKPRICSECKPNEIIEIPETITDPISKDGMTYVKRFKRGTLYCYGCAKKGGSGRQLINCAWGNDEVRGSIASSYLYRNYGYKYSGGRTKVYLELPNYPSMNGYYYLDDSDAGNSEVIDFFCYYKNDLPFGADGTGVTPVECWIVN